MSGHIPAEEAAEMYHNDRPRCGYCGKFISLDNRASYTWQTEYSYNPPDVLDDYPVCISCAIKRGLRQVFTEKEQ